MLSLITLVQVKNVARSIKQLGNQQARALQEVSEEVPPTFRRGEFLEDRGVCGEFVVIRAL